MGVHIWIVVLYSSSKKKQQLSPVPFSPSSKVRFLQSFQLFASKLVHVDVITTKRQENNINLLILIIFIIIFIIYWFILKLN